MKKIIAIVIAILVMTTGVAFAQAPGAQAGAVAGSQSNVAIGQGQVFEAGKVLPTTPDYPALMGPQIQQQIQPTGRDKHWNRTIKPWALKSCWTEKDLNRIQNHIGWNNTISEKGKLQFFPFEDMVGSTKAFTVIPPMKYEEAMKMYKLIAAGTVYATDSETSYMQEWYVTMKANFNTIGTEYVMVLDEGAKEGAEAFGWNIGISIGGQLVSSSGQQFAGATVGAGVANSQSVAQEYPHLTIIFLDNLEKWNKKNAPKPEQKKK